MPTPSVDTICDEQIIKENKRASSQFGNGGFVRVDVTVSGKAELGQLRRIFEDLFYEYETEETRHNRSEYKRQEQQDPSWWKRVWHSFQPPHKKG